MVATGADGKRIIKSLMCNTAAEMLGIWVAPDEDKSKQISILKSAALDWGGKVRIGHSSPEEVWTALHTNISAKLKYPVPACTLTEKNV